MTFELSDEQAAARDRARVFATTRLAAQAQEIDRTSAVPAEIAREAVALLEGCADAVAVVTALEEIAVASGAVAVAAAAGSQKGAAQVNLSGLRGAALPEESPRAQLGLAAVALGVGRAALEQALEEVRRATATPQVGEKPHWVLADVATELDAARLLTREAAQAIDRPDASTAVAIARLMASAAARVTVDAALRITGPEGYRDGTVLERLSRDVRAISLLMGTEEQHRATAAEGLLPG